MDGNAQSATGLEALKQHVKANRMDVAFWCTRGLTLAFLFFYIIPIFGNPYNTYYKALAAFAATSALRLHQRQPCFRLSMQFTASVLMEDSCHYLVYSMIFFYVAPFTLVLIPIFCYSLIHFASYSIRILDVLGPNSLWMARLLISLIELNSRKILNLIAITEIMLMPFCVTLVFTGRASFLTPFMYHQFLVMRYKSQRNPSTRQKFAELRQSALFLANHQKTPAFLRQLIISGIDFVCWLGPTVVLQPSPQETNPAYHRHQMAPLFILYTKAAKVSLTSSFLWQLVTIRIENDNHVATYKARKFSRV